MLPVEDKNRETTLICSFCLAATEGESSARICNWNWALEIESLKNQLNVYF